MGLDDRLVPILAAYGQLIEQYPLAILDSSRLLPKPVMKEILKLAWLEASDSHMRDVAALAYSHLAQFQDGVGPEPVDPTIREDEAPEAVLAILGAWKPWGEKMTAEEQMLRQEFIEFEKGARARPVAPCREGS